MPTQEQRERVKRAIVRNNLANKIFSFRVWQTQQKAAINQAKAKLVDLLKKCAPQSAMPLFEEEPLLLETIIEQPNGHVCHFYGNMVRKCGWQIQEFLQLLEDLQKAWEGIIVINVISHNERPWRAMVTFRTAN